MIKMEFENGFLTCENLSLKIDEAAKGSDICRMARLLIKSGYDRKQKVEIYRGKTLCFVPCSLGWWADRSVEENSSGIRFTKWKSFDGPEEKKDD